MNPIPTDAAGVVTIFAHHEQGGARPASLRLSCPVKLNKFARTRDAQGARVPCPFARIVKHTHVSVVVNFDYAGNVNRQREREDKATDFESQANWFEHVTRSIVQHRHTGERYIFVRVLNFALSAPYFTAGEADEAQVDRAKLIEYLPADDLTDEERARFGLAPDAGNVKQDLEKEVFCITFKLANLRQLVIDGFQYVLTPAPVVDTPAPVTTTKPAPRKRRAVAASVVGTALHVLALQVAANPHAYEGRF